jgi:hypothetical protein
MQASDVTAGVLSANSPREIDGQAMKEYERMIELSMVNH